MRILARLPNSLSLFRLIGAPVVLFLLLKQHSISAALLFFCASGSDWIDGYLARRFSWQSRLGSFLDPIADKLLVFLTCLGLSLIQTLPWWFFFLIIGRDVIILLASLIVLWRSWQISLAPSWLSKINTALQFSVILDCLINPFFPNFPSFIFFKDELLYTTAMTTILSGLDYGYSFCRQFWKR